MKNPSSPQQDLALRIRNLRLRTLTKSYDLRRKVRDRLKPLAEPS